MSISVLSPTPSVTGVRPPVPDLPAPPRLISGHRPRRWPRRRFWLPLMLAVLVNLVLWPAPWHAALRALLVWQAARQGCDLTIEAIGGGPFDTFQLYGLRCRQRSLPTASAASDRTDTGTDLCIARAEITLAWTMPRLQRPASSWVQRIALDGVRGRWDLSAHGRHAGPAGGFPWLRLDALARRLVPADFSLQADDATLRRGRYHLRVSGLFLSASRTGTGGFLARTTEIAGPCFDATFTGRHGQTRWQENRLTFTGLDLGHGVLLARATLDGSHLGRGRLEWDGDLQALGGSVRGQGAVDLSGKRLALDVGGSMRQVRLGPLARLLQITGPVDGLVEQASFSFRGDPENWLAADLWLAGRATDFRWGQRRWESLETQAVVTNRRVQVHRLELRQSRNRLSLDGECSLPPDTTAVAGAADRWWQSGFACNVDARLEDLHALAQLFGPSVPSIAGRMSVNGRLTARPGTQGFDGYLNVEGSALTIRAAPLDFLRSTLVFRGDELDVADLQATHDGDYLTGHGSLRIAGPADFQALGRVSIRDTGVYAPAYADLWPRADAGGAPVRALTAGVRLEGSVLHLDRCQGEQAGNTFQMGGSVDVRDAARPVLDLTLTGEQPPRMADPADADALWRAGLSYALTLRGPLTGGGATIHGGVALVHGHFDRPEALTAPAPGAPLEDKLMQPLLRRLPEAWRDWPLDVRVTAASPLPSGGADRAGEVVPALEITGTGRHPRLGGRLEFHVATGPETAGGAWDFSPGAADHPTFSGAALSGGGSSRMEQTHPSGTLAIPAEGLPRRPLSSSVCRLLFGFLQSICAKQTEIS